MKTHKNPSKVEVLSSLLFILFLIGLALVLYGAWKGINMLFDYNPKIGEIVFIISLGTVVMAFAWKILGEIQMIEISRRIHIVMEECSQQKKDQS